MFPIWFQPSRRRGLSISKARLAIQLPSSPRQRFQSFSISIVSSPLDRLSTPNTLYGTLPTYLKNGSSTTSKSVVIGFCFFFAAAECSRLQLVSNCQCMIKQNSATPTVRSSATCTRRCKSCQIHRTWFLWISLNLDCLGNVDTMTIGPIKCMREGSRFWDALSPFMASKVNLAQTTVDASVLLEGMESCKMKRTIERIPQACHLCKCTNGSNGGTCYGVMVPLLQLGFSRKSRLMHSWHSSVFRPTHHGKPTFCCNVFPLLCALKKKHQRTSALSTSDQNYVDVTMYLDTGMSFL